MDHKLKLPYETSSKKRCSSMNESSSRKISSDQGFIQFKSGNSGYCNRNEQPGLKVPLPMGNQSLNVRRPGQEVGREQTMNPSNPALDWDPRAMLSNLSFLEQKIHQVQDIVRSIINGEGQCSFQLSELAAQQQLVTADLTGVIIQLISTASTLLPSVSNTALLSSNLSTGQLASVGSCQGGVRVDDTPQHREQFTSEDDKAIDYDELLKDFNDCGGEVTETIPLEDRDVKDSEDGMDGEHLPPGSYEILQLEKEEILAPHTHFCAICGKGFKRDANLRMHMRGHGDEYKTLAALAKPIREPNSEPVPVKRYSCPFLGCKRNKEHKKFQPLKTILCVKNHYKRSHCDKSYTCSRCNSKKFSVLADLKTHEKHCGRDKWLCSCGTTFSRKDKLFGHIALFQGHTPALAVEDMKFAGSSDQGPISEAVTGLGSMGYNFAGSSIDNANDLDIKGIDDDRCCFSPMNFDSCNFGGLDEFPRSAFNISENSFSFLPPGSFNFGQKNGENTSLDRLG